MMAAKKKKKKKTNYVLKVVKYILLIMLAVVLIMGFSVLGIVAGAKHSSPELTEANIVPSSDPSVILDDAGEEIIQLSSGGNRRTEATSEEIPEALKWAFVDLEDERFYEHNGIDLKGILRAGYVTLTSSRKEGASTITQQLVKISVFNTGMSERSTGATVKRKIQEWFLAMELEKQMDKEEILLSYMNNINLGAGNIGVQEAANYYFGKDVSELNVTECAVIASITQNPSSYNPARHPENNWERAQKCLKQMYENGHLTEEEYDAAIADDVYSRIVAVANTTAGSSIYSYYVDSLIDQVFDDLQNQLGYTYAQAYNAIYAGGLTIYSNQNTAAQEIIDREINNADNYVGIATSYSISWDLTVKHSDETVEYFNQNHLTQYFETLYGEDWTLDFETTEAADQAVAEYKAYLLKDDDTITYEQIYYTLQPQASFTLMDYTTGKVLAICGGRGTKETSMSLNRATDTTRQPGSTFKIVSAFAPALDMGECTLATAFDDAPYSYSDSGKYIANWWGNSYRGLSSIRLGIIDSMNIVAVKTLRYIGASNCLPYLRSFGYKSIVDGDGVLSTAIGGVTYGITNLENCAAFSAIANSGTYNEPKFYSKILNKDGSVLLDVSDIQDVHQVISTETASLLTSAMQDVVNYGTGIACDISSAPLAGKTGTTNDYRDLWFVGYVPNGLCSCIWVGYDENLSLSSNSEVQKSFYSKIMDQVVTAMDAGGGEFTMQGNIVSATICRKSGKLSNGLCSSDQEGSQLRTEYFTAGTVPVETCDVHVEVEICDETNLLANEYCPKKHTEVRRKRTDLLDAIGASDSSHTGTTWDTDYAVPEKECEEHNENTTTETTTAETEENDESETTTSASTDN